MASAGVLADDAIESPWQQKAGSSPGVPASEAGIGALEMHRDAHVTSAVCTLPLPSGKRLALAAIARDGARSDTPTTAVELGRAATDLRCTSRRG